MSIFKKKKSDIELHPDEVIQEAYDNINKLENQKLPEYYINECLMRVESYRNQKHNAKLDLEIKHEALRIELAEKRKSNPPLAPQTVYNNFSQTKTTTINASSSIGDICSRNKKGINDNLRGNQIANNTGKSKKGTVPAPIEFRKKSKVKLIFFCVVAILVLVGVITLTVRITNCVRDNQDNTSAVLIEYLI